MKKNNPFDIHRVLSKLTLKANEYKTPVVELIEAQTREPWKVLITTMLSARTTDTITSAVCMKLFKKIKAIEDFRLFSITEIEKMIFPVGFYRNKAKFLHALPDVLHKLFNGRIPDSVDELVKLPGVGRKTANLVVSVGFHKPAVCVDTHVHRIMNIWGYVHTKTPFETEMALRKKLPQSHWITVNYLLVSHGQSVCRPISPHCDRCIIADECPKINVQPRKIRSRQHIPPTNKNLSIISWNVNGIRAVAKKGFLEFLKASSAQIIAVQETKAQKDQLQKELTAIEGYYAYWADAKRKGYSGVCIYSKIAPLRIIHGLDVEKFDEEGRVLTLEFDSYFLINCYFPNSQHGLKRLNYKLEFNNAIYSFCRKLSRRKTVIICGDFNVAHKSIDLKNPKSNEQNPGYTIQERQSMDRFINSGFIDTFRMFNKNPDNYTWWSYRLNARERNIGWRIDYFCIDTRSKERVISSEILSHIYGSDHCPIGLTIAKK